MKKFDLDEALNGEPVILRNGKKAVVKYNLLNEVEKLEVRDAEYPLIGYRFDGIYINTTSWSLTGKSVHWKTMEYDIIGMWEEPKLTSEQMNGIAILYDAFSNAENELDKLKNPWIKYNECTPSKDDYFIVHCPEYEPSIAIARYDTDLGGWLDYSDDEIAHWMPLPQLPKE